MPVTGGDLGRFAGRCILITGGGGYLGSALINLLQECDCRILRLERKEVPRGTCPGAATRITDLHGDLRDHGVWETALHGVDMVIHLAAQTSAYVANGDPEADQAVNVAPMLRLLEACRRQGKRLPICFASTVTVAGIPERLPVDESHPDHPLTVYDLHKLMAEQYLRWYSEQGFVEGVSLRLSNLYGPGPVSSSADRGFLNQMIRRALAGDMLTCYGEGDRVRDYLYVEDAARAFLAAAGRAGELSGKTFVVGSGCGHTIAEALGLVARQAALRTGKQVAVERVDPPPGLSPIEDRHFIADSRRFARITGWSARIPLAEGIHLTLEAFS